MDMAFLKSILGVITTLVILGVFSFYLKKINQSNLKNKTLKIKETLNITNKIKLSLVEIGDDLMLFSVSDNEIKFVKKIIPNESLFEKELKENEKK